MESNQSDGLQAIKINIKEKNNYNYVVVSDMDKPLAMIIGHHKLSFNSA